MSQREVEFSFDFQFVQRAFMNPSPESESALIEHFREAGQHVAPSEFLQLAFEVVLRLPGILASTGRTLADQLQLGLVGPYLEAWFVWALFEANPRAADHADEWVALVGMDRVMRDSHRFSVVGPGFTMPPPLTLAGRADPLAVEAFFVKVTTPSKDPADGPETRSASAASMRFRTVDGETSVVVEDAEFPNSADQD